MNTICKKRLDCNIQQDFTWYNSMVLWDKRTPGELLVRRDLGLTNWNEKTVDNNNFLYL